MTPFAKAARTVAGLYNHAQPQGMGYLHYTPEKMPAQDAADIVRRARDPQDPHFYNNKFPMDYVKGRCVKTTVDVLTGEVTNGFGLFDRDNGGDGAGERAVLDGLTDPLYAELDELEE